MSPFKVIAYATRDDYYEKLAIQLSESCNRFNIPIHLQLIDSLGSWELNTHYKGQFIKSCLETLDDVQHFLYVDVDATFMDYPSLIDTLDCEISYRIENFRWRSNEPLSGTIYIKKTGNTIKLLEDWIKINNEIASNRRDPLTWEQYNLQRAMDINPQLSFVNLPAEYCYVDKHTKSHYPDISPVIYHHQASRITCK